MNEDGYLMLSGLQHYAFCPRQFALIHVEQLWEENWRTVDGQLMHEKTDDPTQTELRGDILTVRALHIKSDTLRIVGKCDVVEFHRDESGITLHGRKGKWLPYPVEYKRGTVKPTDADEQQLAAQAICIEEMMMCHIPEGALFYGTTKRRQVVQFSEELRRKVTDNIGSMHDLMSRGLTPKAEYSKSCNACSLVNLCLPKAGKNKTVGEYLNSYFDGDNI